MIEICQPAITWRAVNACTRRLSGELEWEQDGVT
jgi:hypothetical protein